MSIKQNNKYKLNSQRLSFNLCHHERAELEGATEAAITLTLPRWELGNNTRRQYHLCPQWTVELTYQWIDRCTHPWQGRMSVFRGCDAFPHYWSRCDSNLEKIKICLNGKVIITSLEVEFYQGENISALTHHMQGNASKSRPKSQTSQQSQILDENYCLVLDDTQI